VISSFLRGCGEEAAVDESGRREGRGSADGQLVDRVVVTIAPMFLQGYNVLNSQPNTGDGDAASATARPGSGAKACGCRLPRPQGSICVQMFSYHRRRPARRGGYRFLPRCNGVW